MPTLTSQEYVSLDVESTGLNPAIDELIEVGFVVFDREREIDRFSSTVRPRRAVTRDILRLTGISQDELDHSPTFVEIADEVRDRIGDRPIVGHNIAFDISMLKGAGLTLTNRQIDTYRLATALMPNQPNYQLGTISTLLGYDIPADERHRALGDVLGTVHVFRTLLAHMEHYDEQTLRQVVHFAHAAQWPEASVFESARQIVAAGSSFGRANASVPLALQFMTSRERPEPLRPTGVIDPVNISAIESVLGSEGSISKILSGFEPRPTQVTMARRVAQALNEDRNLLIEAGTGTGKSLAYLLPAAMFAVQRGERVVVSTATIALQDQLQRKDLPDVHLALVDAGISDELHVSVMKGRQNYLCLKQFFLHVDDPVEDEFDASLRAKILLWLGTTETGDRAELRLTQEEERHWRKFASERGRCTTARCPYAASGQCFFHRARAQAQHAHIVIANHSLLLSNAAEGRVLPPFERLIVDEAHHLEDEATRQLSSSVDRASLEDALKVLVRNDGSGPGGAIPQAAALLQQMTDSIATKYKEEMQRRSDECLEAAVSIYGLTGELFGRVGQLIGKPKFGGGPGYSQSQRITSAMQDKGRYVDAALIWDRLYGHLGTITQTAAWCQQVLDDVQLPNDDGNPLVIARDDVMVDLMTGTAELAGQTAMLNECFTDLQDAKVYWVQRSGKLDVISLNCAPLDVSELLNQTVYATLRSIIMTSATMTIDGSFDFIAEHLGLTGAKVLDLGSPFDHEESTLVYVPEDIPEPNDPRFNTALCTVLEETFTATNGRGLVLFTSYKALRDARNALKERLEARNIVVLGQGVDGNSRSLIERLRTEPGTVVFGTSSFWEGVDVVGDALSVLVITKFPFAVPSDPIFEARSELYDNAFMELSLPLAVLKFKQGFGRLIRSHQDRGICVILDKRAISKRYGSTFIQSLPPTNVHYGTSRDVSDAASRWVRAARPVESEG